MENDIIRIPNEFEWDSGNLDKSWEKHGISPNESEEIFVNKPLVVSDDITHSQLETRYIALGKTWEGRLLHIVFTIRKNKIRIISARTMNKKERGIYEKA